jgi:hypothetical protein
VKTLRAQLPSGELTLTVGADRAQLSGHLLAFEPPVKEIDGTVYVPLHVVEAALGAQVEYDGRDSKVEIISALVGRIPMPEGGKGAPVTGTVTAVDAASSPPSLTISFRGSVRTISLTSTARVTLEDVSAHTRKPLGRARRRRRRPVRSRSARSRSRRRIRCARASRSGSSCAGRRTDAHPMISARI